MSEWIKTDEQSPPLYVPVLVASGGGKVTTHMAEKSNNGWKWSLYEGWADPHAIYPYWMPLPPPPEREPTTKEALREAIEQIERLVSPIRNGRHSAEMLEAGVDALDVLPRLRSALESEE